mmetsp:Transcript_19033/g.24733  ORF Transcript_19033/g.24733 Transcript_19033/m.24733 type:complete len:214 (+) Transcript_19033:2433-3074(+)
MHFLLFIILKPPWLFHTLTNPVTLITISNVHVFHTKCSTIRLTQGIHHSPQGNLLSLHIRQILQKPLITTRRRPLQHQFTIHILLHIKPMIRRIQIILEKMPMRKRRRRMQTQRIQIRLHMPIHLISPNQMRHTQTITRQRIHNSRGRRRRRCIRLNTRQRFKRSRMLIHTRFQITKVRCPTRMDAVWITFVGLEHLFGIYAVRSAEKGFGWV